MYVGWNEDIFNEHHILESHECTIYTTKISVDFNILRPEQNGYHFANNIFNWIFLKYIFTFPQFQTNNKGALILPISFRVISLGHGSYPI